MNELFSNGDKIYGYCNGFFGWDDYDTKICVTVTNKYAIFQYLEGEFEGYAVALNYPDRLDSKTVSEWKKDPYAL